MEDIVAFLAKSIPIGNFKVKNRLSNLPMEANDAEPDGSPGERLRERYRALGAGGWGIVYVEAISPDDRGKSRKNQMVIREDNLDEFKKLVDAIHGASDPAPMVIFQINHAGRYALDPMPAYRSELLDSTWDITPGTPVATTEELDEAAEHSARAVGLAARAGADGVDLKCCHGYLAAELFRPANNRIDKYGIRFENRIRFFKSMLTAAAEAADEFGTVFGSRISLHENIHGGIGSLGVDGDEFDFENPSELIDVLKDFGGSFVCETMGIPYFNPELVRPNSKQEDREDVLVRHHGIAGYVKSYMPEMKVIGAGYTPFGMRSIAYGVKNIISGDVDIIGYGRQSFADPETAKKIIDADLDAINWCAACPKNNCSTLLRAQSRVGCVVYDPAAREELKKLRNG